MTTRPTVYLAGPYVFRPRPVRHADYLKALCAANGLEGLTPLDGEQDFAALTRHARDRFAMAAAIHAANRRAMRAADAIVADISPFRGPNMDPGTAAEIGAFDIRGLPVFVWTREIDTLAERTRRYGWASSGERDINRLAIENFGLVENLMIAIPAGRIHCSAQDAIEAAAGHLLGTGGEASEAGILAARRAAMMTIALEETE